MTEKAVLEIAGLSKSFGGLWAINDLDLSIRKGELLGIIGPNGAGKTTLINLITGFLKPGSGEIRFKGRDITSSSCDKITRLGIVRTFQLVRPFAHLTSLKNVVIGRLYGAEPARNMKQAKSEAEELLGFVGLSDKRDRIACDLTFAERRKLEMARALATRPEIILLDEVIAGLNPVEIEMTMGMIKKIKNLDITIIFVEHIIKAVMELSTRIVVLDAGHKIAEGPPESIVTDPLVIKSYLGEED